MPKFAATLASLLLIASSIGINIARYPQVGRTIDVKQRTDADEPADSAPATLQSSGVETVNPDSLRANAAEIQPARPSQIATAAPTETARTEEPCVPKPPASGGQLKSDPPLPILGVRPMVPIASLEAMRSSADPPDGNNELRRLPPVEPGVIATPELQATGTGETIQYPATSTP